MSIIIDGQSLRNHIKYLRRQTFLLNKKIENLPSASGVGSDGIMPAPSNQGANISIANLPVKDEDNMASNSDVHLVTQQSVKQFALPLAGGTMTGPLTINHSSGLSITGDGSNATVLSEYSNGDFSINVVNDMELDAGGGDIILRKNGSNFGSLSDSSGQLAIKSNATTFLTGNHANATFAGNVALSGGTLTVGVDDTGYDVKFFGATSGQYMLWDESADKLIVTGEVEAGSIKKASNSGGFLKADGTEDTSTYVKAVSSTTNYIPKFSNATTLTNSGIFNSTSGIYIDSTNTAPVYIRRSGVNSFKFQCESSSNNSFLSISPGLVSKPGLNFGQRSGTGAQDTNTGIYSSATDNLEIATAGTKALGFDANQKATFTNTVTAEKFTVSALNTAPASATASGTLGDIRFTTDYIYVCVATDTWKRVALSTW